MAEHTKEILAAAQEMIEKGYIISHIDHETGKEIWTITPEGRDYLAQLQEHKED